MRASRSRASLPRAALLLAPLLLAAPGALPAAEAPADDPVGEQRSEVMMLSLFLADSTFQLVPLLVTWPADAGPRPAVIVLHDQLGPDGRTEHLARSIGQMGWVTLQPDLLRLSADGVAPPSGGGTGTEGQELGARQLLAILEALSGDPRIDLRRVAVVGLGDGGRAALLAALERLAASELGADGPRFAAHAALYPGCGALRAEGLAAPGPWTAAPEQILAGGRDSRDREGDCDALLQAMPPEHRARTQLHRYAQAGYGWDMGLVWRAPPAALPATDAGAGRLAVVVDDAVAMNATGRVVSFLGAAFEAAIRTTDAPRPEASSGR
ncbi:dienelactone hydrolase family protein [Roseomonas sp. NAR14]|uniref:Dienelactone hydrolase family protein n=1 Tax=Roseomonas acroporae TaxID=2937791 RepID=A0A9X1Y619_9PROT|nr:dienelactone hydrolase family protein [Roseomonas acroporae]MCK8784629.1 dienelactone hydrolase family protein [Roseomonas acroporae]